MKAVVGHVADEVQHPRARSGLAPLSPPALRRCPLTSLPAAARARPGGTSAPARTEITHAITLK
eukprot:4214597-Prymnesium_polylepis.1